MAEEGEQRHANLRGSVPHTSSDPTPAALFELLWEIIADILGTAATATLLRRTARRAGLNGVAISREGLVYRYQVPESWHQADGLEALASLQELVNELRPLLQEMAGPVVLRRLSRVAPLRQVGIPPVEEVRE